MAKPEDIQPVRYSKMPLNTNQIEHLVAELQKAYAYIEELEKALGQPTPTPIAQQDHD